MRENPAAIAAGPFMVTWQPADPVQAPVHPWNSDVMFDVAASVTADPARKLALQTPAGVPATRTQEIPAGVLTIVPLPDPLGVIVSGWSRGANVPVTDRGWFITTVQVLDPPHPPPHPPNTLPVAGVPARLTTAPGSKVAEQVPDWAPPAIVQLIPAGVLLTVPSPVPPRASARGWLGSVDSPPELHAPARRRKGSAKARPDRRKEARITCTTPRKCCRIAAK